MQHVIIYSSIRSF